MLRKLTIMLSTHMATTTVENNIETKKIHLRKQAIHQLFREERGFGNL